MAGFVLDIYQDPSWRRETETGNKLSNLGTYKGDFTAHHIIPIRYMYFLGYILSQTYINLTGALTKTNLELSLASLLGAPIQLFSSQPGKGTYATPASATKFIKDRNLSASSVSQYCQQFSLLCAHITGSGGGSQLPVGNNNKLPADWQPGFCRFFAWLPANLFFGPLSSARVDDPKDAGGNEVESVMPNSFPDDKWGVLQDLSNILLKAIQTTKGTATTPGVGGVGTQTIKIFNVTVQAMNLDQVCAIMEHVSKITRKAYHIWINPFSADDWVVVEPQSKPVGWDAMTGTAKASYLIKNRSTLTTLYPVAEDSISGVEPKSLAWRIRTGAAPMTAAKAIKAEAASFEMASRRFGYAN